MKKFWGKGAAFRTGGYNGNLLLLACCYVLGAVAGYLVYHFSGKAAPVSVTPQWPVFIQYVWHYAKYLLVAFVCGYTALGLLVQPALLAAKGYFMCSAVVSAVTSLARPEAFGVLAENALISVVSLICLFVLSVQGMRGAKYAFSSAMGRRGGYAEPGFASVQLVRFLVCAAAVLAAGAANIALSPYVAGLIR